MARIKRLRVRQEMEIKRYKSRIGIGFLDYFWMFKYWPLIALPSGLFLYCKTTFTEAYYNLCSYFRSLHIDIKWLVFKLGREVCTPSAMQSIRLYTVDFSFMGNFNKFLHRK